MSFFHLTLAIAMIANVRQTCMTRFQLILPVQSQKPPNFKVVIDRVAKMVLNTEHYVYLWHAN